MSKLSMRKSTSFKDGVKAGMLLGVDNQHFANPTGKPVKKRISAITIAITLFFILSLSVLALTLVNTAGKVEGKDFNMVRHVVDGGETLWKIVQQENEGRKYNVREYVYITQNSEHNAEVFKDGGVIQSGDVLYIPQAR